MMKRFIRMASVGLCRLGLLAGLLLGLLLGAVACTPAWVAQRDRAGPAAPDTVDARPDSARPDRGSGAGNLSSLPDMVGSIGPPGSGAEPVSAAADRAGDAAAASSADAVAAADAPATAGSERDRPDERARGGGTWSAAAPGAIGMPLPRPGAASASDADGVPGLTPPAGQERTADTAGGNGRADAADDNEFQALLDVSNALDKLVQGSVAISAPASVDAHQPFELAMRISTGKLDTLIASLRQDFPGNDTVLGGSTRLATTMTASVEAPDLEVFPKDPVRQTISLTEVTTWQWQAKAQRAGTMIVTFTLVGTHLVAGQERARNYYFRRRVQVRVTPAGMLAENWQWLASSIVIPLLVAGWAWWRGRPGELPAQDADKPKRRRRA